MPVYPVNRFIYGAVENLIINRFIDARQGFYNLAKNYYLSLRMYNDQLTIWGGASTRLIKDLESWYLDNKENLEKEALAFEKEIIAFQIALVS